MKLINLNRAIGIGSSCLYLEIGPFRILIDAGLNPTTVGHASTPDFALVEDRSLDFVVLTHCHLDHLGSLPIILRRQPQAEVFMSFPSRMIADRMLHNSCNIMLRQREELGILELPLYTHGEVKRLTSQTQPLTFGRTQPIHAHSEEISLTLFPAGHVIGASGILLEYKNRRIFITGDVMFSPQRTLSGAAFPEFEVDTLIMETTRGATVRSSDAPREVEITRLINCISHVLSHGGSVLVPVFALGRMQEVLTLVWEARRSGKIPSCPVYCSGLGLGLSHQFDEISRRTRLVKFRRRIMKDLKIQRVPLDLQPGIEPTHAGLYIVSSGMLVTNTPSYVVAASLLGSHRNAILFVGYCDPDTPGGQLLATDPGESYVFDALNFSTRVHARVERFDLTGHAERKELLDYALITNPRAVVLTHGDPEARAWFHDELTRRARHILIVDPEPGAIYQV